MYTHNLALVQGFSTLFKKVTILYETELTEELFYAIR